MIVGSSAVCAVLTVLCQVLVDNWGMQFEQWMHIVCMCLLLWVLILGLYICGIVQALCMLQLV